MAWQYKRTESEYTELPEGRYRVLIVDAEMATSQKGNDMLVIKMLVSGTKRYLWNYITFLDDRPEITNRMLTQFFDSFGIRDGDFDIKNYIGRCGGCQVKHDNDGKAKVHYFIDKKQQEKLPPWEGDIPRFEDFKELEDDDEELPF